MNEALELIQKKLTEYGALYDKADARVRAAQEQKQLAEQERTVYSDSIDELNRAAKTLQKVATQERKASEKQEEEARQLAELEGHLPSEGVFQDTAEKKPK